MLGKINEELDSIQKKELRVHIGKIEKALSLLDSKDKGLPSLGLSKEERWQYDEAVTAVKMISNFLDV